MANTLVALVGVIYAVTAVAYYLDGKPGFAAMFVGYAIANAGVIMAARGV